MTPGLWGTGTAVCWGTADFVARFSGRAVGHHSSLLGMLGVGSLLLTGWMLVEQPAVTWTFDAILLVIDASVGATATDEAASKVLRRSKKPVLLVANKVDDDRLLAFAQPRLEGARQACARLGLDDPATRTISLSADSAVQAISHWRTARPRITGVCA